MNTASPSAAWVPGSGASYGESWFSTHVAKSSAERATISIRMLACDRPQNSAHWPAKIPGWSASRRSVWMRPGTTSRLPLIRGTQKLWITSRLVPRNSTFVSTGITS